MKNKTLTISIINFKTWKETKDCVKSCLLNIKDIDYKIILSDNTLKDEEGVIPETNPWDDELVMIIRHDRNTGFGFAHNYAFNKSNSDFFLVLNNDTELTGHTNIGLIIDYLNNNEKAGVVGIKMEGSNSSAFNYFPNLLNLFFIYYFNHYPKNVFIPNDKPQQCMHINGAFMFFRSEAYRKLNGFSSDFFLYFEDTDLCYRMIQHDYSVIYLPYLTYIHKGGASARIKDEFSQAVKSNYHEYHKSLIQFMKTNRSIISGKITKYMLIIVFMIKSVKNYIMNNQIKSKGYNQLWKQIVKI